MTPQDATCFAVSRFPNMKKALDRSGLKLLRSKLSKQGKLLDQSPMIFAELYGDGFGCWNRSCSKSPPVRRLPK